MDVVLADQKGDRVIWQGRHLADREWDPVGWADQEGDLIRWQDLLSRDPVKNRLKNQPAPMVRKDLFKCRLIPSIRPIRKLR